MLSGLEWKSYFWLASRRRLRSADSRVRSEDALERLYLIAAIAILSATCQGMAVQVAQLQQQLTRTGGALSAILKLAGVGCKGYFIKHENYLASFHCCLKAHNPFLHPNGLNVISLTRFDSPASAP